jgi:crossover junction endodeoxyribonuclease RuvC
VVSYAATQVKRLLTGNGRASKEQIQLAVTRELSLAAPPDPPDVADALAIALSHWCQHTRPELCGDSQRGVNLDRLAEESAARRKKLLGQ